MTIFCILTGYCCNMLKAQTGPGGVNSNLALWLSADSGGASWTDRSASGTTVTKYGTVTSNNNQVNFNPALSFGTSNSYYDTNLSIARGTYANVSIFTVANGRGENSRMIFSSSSANNHRTLTSNAFTCGSTPSYTAQNGYGVYNAGYVTTTSNASKLLFNGVQQVATTDNNGTPINLKIGGGYYSTNSADIAEMVVYRGTLTPDQTTKIQSYLALKYGATLPSSYMVSDGTVVWDNSVNSGYNNNIAGIGWDYDSGLNQKQSQSVNGGFQPIIGNGSIATTNIGNNNSFNEDGTFMVWGSDTGSTTFSTAFSYGGLNYRMARIWKMQKTKTLGMVKVAVPVSLWPGAVTQPSLLVSGTTAFDGTSIKPMTQETIGGISYYTVTLDPSSVQYFSFAGLVTAPGGVIGANLWLKEGNSNSSSIWYDFSVNSNNATNANGSPIYNTSGTDLINFNPSYSFSGSRFDVPSGAAVGGGSNSANYTLIGVAKLKGSSNNRVFSSINGSNKLFGYYSNIENALYVEGSPNYISSGSNGVIGATTNLNIFSLDRQNGGALVQRKNGSQVNSSASSDYSSWQLSIGGSGKYGEYSDAVVTEVIAYPTTQLGNLNKIESYLALKYGITKSGDYIASDATTYWNSTSNSGYQNNIAGIGKDNASALNQKQSQSVSSGIQPVIGNLNISDTNANNSNDFATDKTFMVWGSDTGSTNFATSFAFGGLNNRMARTWKVQKTGTIGTVKVAIPVSMLPGSVTKLALLAGGTTVFDATSVNMMGREIISGVDYYTTTLDFSAVQYFSFAAFVTSPGGVLGTTSWFKADSGTNLNNGYLSTWANQAINSDLLQLSQATASRQPAFKINSWNFNPNIMYDGSDDIMEGTMSSLLNVLSSKSNDVFGIVNIAGGANAKVYLQISDDGACTNRLTLEGTSMTFPTCTDAVTTGISNTSSLPSIFNAATTSGNTQSYTLNGGTPQNGTFTGSLGGGATPRFMVGGYRQGSTYAHSISGNFPEIITYNSTLTPTQKKQIQSYLAIKYGQTILHDYLASDGTTVYNISSYSNNIAGIGRDDASALSQKQSQSVNGDIQPVIGNMDIADTNANNSNVFTADKSFLVWGSDTGSTSFATPFAYGNSNFRMTRIWKVQKTGTIGKIKVAIPVSQLPLVISQPSLLISADATFDGNDTKKPMTSMSLGGVQYYVAEVDTNVDGFTSGSFFSFAGFVTAPGGVAGVSLWLKADKGVSYNASNQVSAWNDQSGSTAITTQATSINSSNANAIDNSIVWNPGSVNFNPSVVYNYTSGRRLLGYTSSNSTWSGNLTMYGVAVPTGSAPYTGIFSSQYKSLGRDNNGSGWIWVTDSNGNTNFGSQTSLPFNQLSIGNGIYKSDVLTDSRIYRDGTDFTNGSSANSSSSPSNYFEIGGRTVGGGSLYSRVMDGKIPEVIVYNTDQSILPLDMLRINSYLSIKYGNTLGRNNNGNATYGEEIVAGSNIFEGDYIASDKTKFWNTDATYQNNIAGIGRDGSSALLQKQSQSSNAGYQLIVGLSTVAVTNAANTGTLNNLQFLMWGDNNAANTAPFTAISGYNSRLNRVWKVQNTNTVNQSVQVLVPVTTSTVAGLVPATSSLLCGTDATFAGSYQVYNPAGTVTINSVSYLAFNVPASMVNKPSFYMTLAFYEQSPGGVRDELLWLRGDKDLTSATLWKDQSANHNDLQFSTNACNELPRGQMVLGETLNFNPVSSFGDNDNWVWGYTPANIAYGTSASSSANAKTDVAIVYKTDGAYAQDVWGTDWGGPMDERSLTTTQVANGNTGVAYSGGNSGAATINVASFNGVASNGSNILINGNNVLNFTGSTRFEGCTSIRLGDIKGAGNVLKGVVGDMVVYRKNMGAIERMQLNSYLAMKYGITLGRDNDGDGTPGEQISASPSVYEGDYLASDGTTKTWSSDAVYQNNVVAIGRDDISAFHQRITMSQSAIPDIITLSTDSNFTNVNQSGASGHTDIATDKYFFVTGNNNGATSYAKKLGLSNGLNALMKRVWKVQKAGTAQDIYIKTTDNLATYLVYSADATFSTGVTYVQLSAGATSGVQIPNGNYFTLATFMKWPGGVEDEVVWLRGDIGLTGTQTWLDQSGNSNNLRFDINDCMAGSAGQMTLGKTFNYNNVAGFGPGTGWTWGMIQADISRLSTPDADVAIMYKADAVKEQDVWGTDLGGLLDERSMLTTKVANDNTSIAYSGGNSGYATINIASFKNTASNGSNILINGNNVLNFTGSNTYNGCSIIRLGDVPGNREDYNPFTGVFGEFVVYKKNITSTQRIQLNSYLALKYGITLGRDNDGNGTSGEDISSPIKEGDYLASYGSAVRIWNSDANYQNNIIGIGRDDITGLHQRITKSQMPVTDIIMMSTDSNFTNNNQSGTSGHTDVVNDKSYFITGHNGQPTSYALKSGLSNSLNAIMNRVWKVQQTGTAQNIFIKVDNARATYLIYSSDPTFSSGVTYKMLTTGVTPGVQIPSGNYFTFAAPLNGPGGVTDNLVRWYRADRDVVAGSTLTWKDQTVNADATQTSTGDQPVYNTSGTSLLNFNPSFTFDGQSDYLSFSDTRMASGSSSRSVFGVGRTSVTGGTFEWLSSYGTSNTAQNFGLMRSANNVLVTTYGNDFVPYSTNPYASNTPVISYGAAAGGTLYGTYNALPIQSGSYTVNTVLNTGRIGTRQSYGEYWNGVIGEVVHYNKIPTPAEKAKVDSYLALKYGVSLGSSSNAFVYVGSDGSAFWSGTDLGVSTYQNNIAAIGRDDISDLNQKQSQSVNAGRQVIIGLGNIAATNEANTGSFDNNLQFLAWGDNNTDMVGNTSAFTAVYPYQERLSRVWRVQNTNSLSKDIQLLIPATYIKDLKVSSLLYSTDASFATGSQIISSTATGVVTVNSVDYKAFTIPAAQVNQPVFYFTMAYYKKSPGGVVGENLWLRADDGVSATTDNTPVAQWNDQSANNSHGTQATTAKQPVYKNNATDNMNFNPVLAFNATNAQNFDIAGNLGIGGQKGVAVFGVSDTSSGARYFLEPKTTGTNLLEFRSDAAGSALLKSSGSTSATGSLTGFGAAALYSGWTTSAATGNMFGGVNGNQSAAATLATNWTAGSLSLGAAYNQTAFTTGKIPEVAEYSKVLTATELQKVNSYLALKYGITMDQTTIQDYLASDGNKSWTKDATYKYNIAGIGRDDLTALNQKQSQSVNKGASANIETDSQLLVALNAVETGNTVNTATFSSDMQYLVWGDDNGSLTTRTTTGNVSANGLTYTKRFTRVWKVQNKGNFADKVGIYYPVSAFGSASSSSIGLIFASTAAKLSDGTASVISNSGKETINGVEYYAFYLSSGIAPAVNYLSFTTATSVCYKPAVTAGTALSTKAGITTLGRAGVNADNWPMVRKGGWIALEAQTKGMIINRVRFKDFGPTGSPNFKPVDDTETNLILTNPQEGMIVMDISNRMLKVYTTKNGTPGWYQIGQQTCPD